MDRRKFIKVSGAAAAGMAIAGCVPKGSGSTGSAGSTSSPTDNRSLSGVEGQDFSGRIAREVDAFALSSWARKSLLT